MARDDQQGEMPAEHSQVWRDVRQALGRAQDMSATAVRCLRTLQQRPMRPLVWSGDPRLATRPSALQSRVRSLLTTHFRLRNPGPFDILNLTDGYHRIHQRLLGIDRKSFRMVTASVVNEVAETGNGDTFGYVRPEQMGSGLCYCINVSVQPVS